MGQRMVKLKRVFTHIQTMKVWHIGVQKLKSFIR